MMLLCTKYEVLPALLTDTGKMTIIGYRYHSNGTHYQQSVLYGGFEEICKQTDKHGSPLSRQAFASWHVT